MLDHTERFLNASARQLNIATIETVSTDQRISAAFVSAYNSMQAVQPLYAGSLGDHPLASTVTTAAALLELSESDLVRGLALLQWEDFGRYQLQRSPVTVEGAVAWAARVRNSALKHQASVGEK
jgi:hypothetical protein